MLTWSVEPALTSVASTLTAETAQAPPVIPSDVGVKLNTSAADVPVTTAQSEPPPPLKMT